MLSETNGKWTTRTADITSSKMKKKLGRETRCYHVDSKSYEAADSDWLQGEMMNVRQVKYQV